MLLSKEIPIRFGCRANGEVTTTLWHGEPLTFSLSVINEGAIHDASYNAAIKSEIETLERNFNEKQIMEARYREKLDELRSQMKPERILILGGPEGWTHFIKFRYCAEGEWKEFDYPLHILLYYPQQETVEFNGTTSCYIDFGLDPEDADR